MAFFPNARIEQSNTNAFGLPSLDEPLNAVTCVGAGKREVAAVPVIGTIDTSIGGKEDIFVEGAAGDVVKLGDDEN